MIIDKKIFYDNIFNEPGFTKDFKISEYDLYKIRNLVEGQWLERIRNYDIKLEKIAQEYTIDGYHQFSELVPHDKLWGKNNRILKYSDVLRIKKLKFYHDLKKIFGNFIISNEEGIELEEIYWRLVRPNKKEDVGPLHADSWFWDLGHGKSDSNTIRIKLWMPLYSEPGLNGFRYVSNSHLMNIKYVGEKRNGILKPKIIDDENNFKIEVFDGKPGEAIIFNDKLLHGGMVGGSKTRVSIEFTILIKI